MLGRVRRSLDRRRKPKARAADAATWGPLDVHASDVGPEGEATLIAAPRFAGRI